MEEGRATEITMSSESKALLGTSTAFTTTKLLIVGFVSVNLVLWPLLTVFVIIPALKSNGGNNDDVTPTPYPQLHTIFPTNVAVTGIRGAGAGNVLITGMTGPPFESVLNTSCLLYMGPLSTDAIPTQLNSSSLYIWNPVFEDGKPVLASGMYGPNTRYFDSRIPEGSIFAVGSYYTGETKNNQAFYYEGPLNGSGVSKKIVFPPKYLYEHYANGSIHKIADPVELSVAHSTMGDLIVGNVYYQSSATRGYGFIYDKYTGNQTIIQRGFSTTLYGIWQNNGQDSTHYAIIGGHSPGNYSENALDVAFIETYDSATGQFSGFTGYPYPNTTSHFEGIVAVAGGYNVACQLHNMSSGLQTAAMGFIPHNNDNPDVFGSIEWFIVNNTITNDPKLLTTADTVIDYVLLGAYYTADKTMHSYFVNTTNWFAQN